MKILIIGGEGTIGKKVVSYLSKNHSIITAGRKNGEIYLDLSKKESIKQLFENNNKFDAVISIAGQVIWAPFSDISEDDFYIGIKNKMMGQVNLVQIGQNYINPGGSFTLTTGILADKPVKMTTAAALVAPDPFPTPLIAVDMSAISEKLVPSYVSVFVCKLPPTSPPKINPALESPAAPPPALAVLTLPPALNEEPSYS